MTAVLTECRQRPQIDRGEHVSAHGRRRGRIGSGIGRHGDHCRRATTNQHHTATTRAARHTGFFFAGTVCVCVLCLLTCSDMSRATNQRRSSRTAQPSRRLHEATMEAQRVAAASRAGASRAPGRRGPAATPAPQAGPANRLSTSDEEDMDAVDDAETRAAETAMRCNTLHVSGMMDEVVYVKLDKMCSHAWMCSRGVKVWDFPNPKTELHARA